MDNLKLFFKEVYCILPSSGVNRNYALQTSNSVDISWYDDYSVFNLFLISIPSEEERDKLLEKEAERLFIYFKADYSELITDVENMKEFLLEKLNLAIDYIEKNARKVKGLNIYHYPYQKRFFRERGFFSEDEAYGGYGDGVLEEMEEKNEDIFIELPDFSDKDKDRLRTIKQNLLKDLYGNKSPDDKEFKILSSTEFKERFELNDENLVRFLFELIPIDLTDDSDDYIITRFSQGSLSTIRFEDNNR